MEPLIAAGTAAAVGALSPLAGKAAEKAAEKLGEIFMQFALEQGGKKIFGVFGKSADEVQNVVFGAARKYVESYGERHGILKVLGMREPVSLEQVYTTVQFLGEDLRQFESIEDLEKAYRQADRRRFQTRECPKQDGLKVASDQQFLMVLGQPGAGKSTFLRRMGLEVLKGQQRKYKHACIPVMLELRSFNRKEINLEKAIVEEFRTCGFPKPEAATKKLLEQGKLLILLDGLDEVATDQMDDAIRSIQDFVQLHDKNRFIASCRVATYRGNFKRFSDVAMADFDDEQIQQFISNWFGSDAALTKECWDKLNSNEHRAAKELTQTPLLLTLICLLYQRSRKFPTNRSTLYERALRVLLEEWAAEKGIPQQEVYKGLDTKRKEMLLSEIAYKAFETNRLFIPKRELTRDIEELLKELLPEEKIVDGNAVLRAIAQQHGVLVARAEEIYSFSHLTLQPTFRRLTKSH
jgi:predicted NACHT family NTPase